MKKVTIMFALMAMILVFNGCKKDAQNNISQDIVTTEKFYKTTSLTNTIVRKAMDFIEKSNRYNNLNDYVKKFGYPVWDKAIIKTKVRSTAQKDISDNTTEDDYLLIPTVFTNGNQVIGFIAVDVSSTGIQFTSKLVSNYSDYPYKSTNATGVTAESILSCYFILEKETFDINKFFVFDNQLSFFRTPNTSNGIYYLQIGSSDVTGAVARETICYWERWVYSTHFGDFPLTDWVALFCWEEGIDLIVNSTDEGGGSSGGSGGSSTPPPTTTPPPPPPPLTDEELCQLKFEEMVDATDGSSDQTFGMSMDIDPLNKTTSIGWVLVTNPAGWQVNSYWIGDITRATPNSPWTWVNLKSDKVEVVGTVLGGTVTPTLNSTIINYDAQKRYATVSTNVTIQNVAACIQATTRTLIFNKWTVFKAGQY